MDRPTSVPLHLTSLAILAPSNAPLYVHAFTGKEDELRAYHLAHAAVDVIEERIVMTATPNRPPDCYLGLLFCMEDMAFYGFQTHAKLRMVLSIALVDAAIKDSDIVAVFRAVNHLLLQAINNPFLSLPTSFKAAKALSKPIEVNGASPMNGSPEKVSKEAEILPESTAALSLDAPRNEPVPENTMFASGPDDIKPEWLTGSKRFTNGIERLGEILCART